MFSIKKSLLLLILVLAALNIEAQGEFKLITERDFAITNEFLGLTLLSNDASIEAATYLVIKDNQGTEKLQMPGNMKNGVAAFKFQVPPSWKEGWYQLFVFTKDSNSGKFAELCHRKLAVYDSNPMTDFNTEINNNLYHILACANEPKIASEPTSSSDLQPGLPIHLIRSKDVSIINAAIDAQSTFKKNADVLERSLNHTILINLDENVAKKNFVAFFNTDKEKVQGLRQLENNTFSLEVDNIYAPVNGQFLSISAFGVIKFLSASTQNHSFELPEFEPINSPLPKLKELGDYIERHKKRLIIMSLYEQEYEQLSKVEVERNTDIIYYTKEYIQFNSTNEFINEVLQVVRYNDKSQEFSVLSEDKVFQKDPPLLLLNGKIVSNSKDIIGINYKDIESIEIVRLKNNLRESFSTFGRNGVVSVVAKTDIDKYESSYFNWQNNNKMTVKLNPKNGPDYSETVLSLNELSKPFYNSSMIYYSIIINQTGQWVENTCKIDSEL